MRINVLIVSSLLTLFISCRPKSDGPNSTQNSVDAVSGEQQALQEIDNLKEASDEIEVDIEASREKIANISGVIDQIEQAKSAFEDSEMNHEEENIMDEMSESHGDEGRSSHNPESRTENSESGPFEEVDSPFLPYSVVYQIMCSTNTSGDRIIDNEDLIESGASEEEVTELDEAVVTGDSERISKALKKIIASIMSKMSSMMSVLLELELRIAELRE